MKKTTPALIATFISTTVLGAGMLMIGIDAMRTSASTAANSSAALIQQNSTGSQAASVSLNTSRSSFRTPTLRTGGS